MMEGTYLKSVLVNGFIINAYTVVRDSDQEAINKAREDVKHLKKHYKKAEVTITLSKAGTDGKTIEVGRISSTD